MVKVTQHDRDPQLWPYKLRKYLLLFDGRSEEGRMLLSNVKAIFNQNCVRVFSSQNPWDILAKMFS